MNHHDLLAPMFAQMLLTLLVWAYMYARRLPFILSLDIDANALTPAELARLSPPAVSNPSDNLKNLFELPVLFYALVLYLHFSGLADSGYVLAAWAFVGFRALHSLMHSTVNIVVVRFGLYLLSALGLWYMLVRAALQHFVGG